MSSSKQAPETSSDITQLSSDVSRLNITDNNDANDLVSNESNTTNTLTTGTLNTYRWADELDDTDSSFSKTDSENTEIESEGEERGHTKFVVKLTNLAKNTTIKQVREILPRELQIYYITFDNPDNSSALVSFKDDRHMLKALQHSGKIMAPNTGSASGKNKDNYVFIDPWEEPKSFKSLDNVSPITIQKNKFTNNLYKSNSERIIRHDNTNDSRADLTSSRSFKDDSKPPSGERQKLVLKPRSKPLNIEIPPLSKINEHDSRSNSGIIRKTSVESVETTTTKTTSTQVIQKKKSVDKAIECNLLSNLDPLISNDQPKRNYDKKYKVEKYERVEKYDKHDKYERMEKYERLEKYEKSDRSIRRERQSEKYEKFERVENMEHKSRVKSGRYSKDNSQSMQSVPTYSKEYSKDSPIMEDEYRRHPNSYTKSHTLGVPKEAYSERGPSGSGGKYIKRKQDSPGINSVDGDSYNQSHRSGSNFQDYKNYDDKGGRYTVDKGDKAPKGVERKTPRPPRRKNAPEDVNVNPPLPTKSSNLDERKKGVSHVVKPIRRKRQSVS